MAWVWKSPTARMSSQYALREDAIKAAVRHAQNPRGTKVALKDDLDPVQLNLLWTSLKRGGWSVYQVDT